MLPMVGPSGGLYRPLGSSCKPREARLASIAQPVRFTIDPLSDREETTRLAIKHDLPEIPDVGANKKFLGVVTLDNLLDVVASNYSKNLLKYAGIAEAIKGSYIAEKPYKLVLKRAPVILYLYLMKSVAGGIVASFHSIIERIALLSAFMSVLAANSGDKRNIGFQASALVIRG